MKKRQKVDKNSMPIDDSDGKLHLYTMVAFKGERWGLQFIFPTENMTQKDFEHYGNLLILSAKRKLFKEKILPDE